MDKLGLEASLYDLTTHKRYKLAAAIEAAIQTGDLSEGSLYDKLKEEQEQIESEIRTLRNLLRVDEEISRSASKEPRVKLGSRVKVLEIHSNQEDTYELVTTHEGNSFIGKIHCETPMGKALLGQSQGQEIQLDLPVGKLRFKIMQIQ